MSYPKYKGHFTGHFANARLLMSKYLKEKDLALMTDEEIEKKINDWYIAIQLGDDWMLVPREKVDAFEKMITWICR